MKHQTFCLFALILLQRRVEPLQCYQCNTATIGEACADPLNQTLLQPNSCNKTSTKDVEAFAKSSGIPLQESTKFQCVFYEILVPAQNVTRINRACSPETIDICYIIKIGATGEGEEVLRCETCSTDGCNGGKSDEKEDGSGSDRITALGLFIFIILQVLELTM